MTEMRDYESFANDPLVFPIRGKHYPAVEVGIDLGMRLSGITTGAAEQDMPAVDLWRLVLGDSWDQMVADGVPLDAATRAGMAAIADFQHGREYALVVWETGNDPKALTEHMAAKAKAEGNRATRRSRSTASASKTPSPASSKATTSRKS